MFPQRALEDVSSLATVWVTESTTSPTGAKTAGMERAIPGQERGTGVPLGAVAACPCRAGRSQALPTGRKSDSRRERTVINRIIIRNKPRALAECLHCHAGTAHPALGSLARQTWGCSRSPNHTHPVQGQGEASGDMARAKGRPAATSSGARAPADPAW